MSKALQSTLIHVVDVNSDLQTAQNVRKLLYFVIDYLVQKIHIKKKKILTFREIGFPSGYTL